MAHVLFDEATRVYPGTELPASHDLDLAVADGEFLVIKGPPATEKPSSPPAAERWDYSPRNYSPAAGNPQRPLFIAKPSSYPWPNNSWAPWQFSQLRASIARFIADGRIIVDPNFA